METMLQRRVKRVAQIIGTNTLAALLGPVFVWALNHDVSQTQLLWTFKFSLVYAQIIGGLAHVILARCWGFSGRWNQTLRWVVVGLALFLIAITGSLLAGLVFVLLDWNSTSAYWAEFRASIKIATVITLAFGLVISAYEVLRDRLEQTNAELTARELERERALKLAAQARLSSLESRVHPHFLFNTLNSISALIREDPDRADHLVEKMAALLRSSLDSHSLVALGDEMKIVADYLEIEKARFGERLQYDITVPEELAYVRLPPFSVQTLVENSVKYAVSCSRNGGRIRITAEQNNGALHLAIADTGPGFDLASAPAGHGIDNLRSRLTAIFEDRARLHTGMQEGWHAVYLILKLEKNSLEKDDLSPPDAKA
jgi:two-component system sensor histidine kinase AlgZ